MSRAWSELWEALHRLAQEIDPENSESFGQTLRMSGERTIAHAAYLAVLRELLARLEAEVDAGHEDGIGVTLMAALRGCDHLQEEALQSVRIEYGCLSSVHVAGLRRYALRYKSLAEAAREVNRVMSRAIFLGFRSEF